VSVVVHVKDFSKNNSESRIFTNISKNLLITKAKKCAYLKNKTEISFDVSLASSVEDD